MKLCKTEKEYIEAIAPAVQEACKKYGYLPSVLIAQSCLENGYGIPDYWDNPQIELLMIANNMVGMKAELLTSSWAEYSVWPGRRITKQTPEEYNGQMVTITDDFRAYDSIEQCFCDYLLFIKYASNFGRGGVPKYGAKVLSIRDPETLIKTVSNLGYATGSTYPTSVMRIINKHDLTKYDDNKVPEKFILDITARNLYQVPRGRNGNPIQFIVVHYLGVPNADNPDLYGGGYGGHYYVSRAGQIYKAADPRKAVTWHCGGGLQGSGGHQYHGICTNYNSIGIECGVCYTENVKDADGDSNKWYFTTETQESLVWLVSKLMDEYGIGIDHVIRHYDVTGKICPNPYVKNNRLRTSWTWGEFKAKLSGSVPETPVTPSEPAAEPKYYRVRKSWDDAGSQKGAYTFLANAKACADENPGYCVYDYHGKCVYESKAGQFQVRVSIDDLNIRKGPGTNYERTGKYTGKGIFTIIEVKSGKGSTAGWGCLLSGAGWISLDFAERI